MNRKQQIKKENKDFIKPFKNGEIKNHQTYI